MRKRLLFILAPALLSSCALQEPLLKKTPSGYPEASFYGQNIDLVRGELSDACATRGFEVNTISFNHIICSKKASSDHEKLFVKHNPDTSFTEVSREIQFILYSFGQSVRVRAYQWLEGMSESGQTVKYRLRSNAHTNQLQRALFQLGGK